MPPIRQMMVGMLIAMLFSFGLIFFIGGYETANNLTLNATIATSYNAIIANPSSPQGGVFCGKGACVSNLSASVNSTAIGLQTYSNNPLGNILNTVSVVAGYLFEIPSFFSLLSGFIAAPLILFLPVGFAQVIADVVLVVIFVFGLLSGIFLVPM